MCQAIPVLSSVCPGLENDMSRPVVQWPKTTLFIVHSINLDSPFIFFVIYDFIRKLETTVMKIETEQVRGGKTKESTSISCLSHLLRGKSTHCEPAERLMVIDKKRIPRDQSAPDRSLGEIGWHSPHKGLPPMNSLHLRTSSGIPSFRGSFSLIH